MSGETTAPAEPVESRPWNGHGQEPTVWTWPAGDRPALYVWSLNQWRYARVHARQDWPDGKIVYQVAVDLDGSTTTVSRSYPWPQPGLRRAHGSQSAPSDSAPPVLTSRRRAAVIESGGS
ncbi:hypothetical protein [Streptomyces virginiae]|uniref:hypothetical protein n=1 Tax=Streptomyces virginiae TaxID=1961 RepID=UPI0036647AD7